MTAEMLKSVATAALYNQSPVTPPLIRETLANYSKVPGCEVNRDELEALAKEFESRLDVKMSTGWVLQEDFTPWLAEARQDIEPYYWNRYRLLLERKNFPPTVIAKIDEVTERTLDLLENPLKEGLWDRRGMVVGHVQSGKTANYTGLICKAADAGYRLIIIIAGIQNSLRNQTQERIDEGFVGRDSSRLETSRPSRYVGVGRIDRNRLPVTLTTCIKDFNRQMASSFGVQLSALRTPTVLVIKKNTNTLTNLVNWLREHNVTGGGISSPMLLIDDEADNASIDINASPDQTSRINSQIRELLNLFERKCYVGYTATPFANIFIDPDTVDDMLKEDLFPRDFIVTLDAPSNYFGADRVFTGGEERGQHVREIEDHEDLLPIRHKIDHVLVSIPESLKEAIRIFVLSRALRLIRGHVGDHNSMMINASRFISVQGQLRNHVHDYLRRMEEHIRYEASKSTEEALGDEYVADLHLTWRREFSCLEAEWPSVQSRLLEAISPMNVIEVNSRSSGALNYRDHADSGLNVIAVGGFGLSRGLTLEGLTVSYFLRNSMMYDTLMQMGRWFGYRHGYEDLCRIWMTPEAIGWYEHISGSLEELRADIREMEQARLRPKDFGLKVRSHPDSLIVTARNKMRSAQRVVVQIDLAKKYIETHTIWRDANRVERNRRAISNLVRQMGGKDTCDSDEMVYNNNYLWRSVPAEMIMDYLLAFDNHPMSIQTQTEPVREYIKARQDDELSLWDVVVVNKGKIGEYNKDAKDHVETHLFDFSVVCPRRAAGPRTNLQFIQIGTKQRVASRPIEHIGLDQEIVDEVNAAFSAEEGNQTRSVPDFRFREKRTRPLLVLHVLKIDGGKVGPVADGVTAWGISFPATEKPEETVGYVVNTTWWKEHFSAELDEEL
ncbi:MAG: Z1 domain-containing protein [Deltaproteobacteria bacterium]|nr:Z1 domain-containing protein [Deltaproteobacteria bacterium]